LAIEEEVNLILVADPTKMLKQMDDGIVCDGGPRRKEVRDDLARAALLKVPKERFDPAVVDTTNGLADVGRRVECRRNRLSHRVRGRSRVRAPCRRAPTAVLSRPR